MVLGGGIPPIVETEPAPVAKPQILWPTMVLGENGYIEGDLKWFPEADSYYERFRIGIGGAMSCAFKDAVRVARQRVWLLDEYLLGDDASRDQLWSLFCDTVASDLRVVTGLSDGAHERAQSLKELEPALQARTTNAPPQIKIYLNLKRPLRGLPEIHDRFAIIDDVLWHCGATVGGLHHQINAMTFGWCAQATRAVEFFNQICRLLDEDIGRSL
ncbi:MULTISPECIES: hypothetical protein [unclassified Bradyrhizobium]|uniref:hypothetical protein n=1 Tax=unclassified Bradyrhizobium TaxID=2631580 RepID=UPI002916E6D5|nr:MULTISPECIES: hypothetical protein [unclassified Bradyrhizobium]